MSSSDDEKDDPFKFPRNPRLDSRLIASIRGGDVATVRQRLLDLRISGKNQPDLQHDLKGANYLHIAASSGDRALAVVVLLISEFGFSLSTELAARGRALHLACENGRQSRELIRYLLTYPDAGVNEEVSSYSSQAPLGVASERGDVETMKLLLKAGADPNARDGTSRYPLHYSLMMGPPYAAAYLLFPLLREETISAVREDLLRTNDEQLVRTALHHDPKGLLPGSLLFCGYSGKDRVVQPLLEAGAWDPNEKRLGRNAIEVARDRGHPGIADMIEAFITKEAESGADPAHHRPAYPEVSSPQREINSPEPQPSPFPESMSPQPSPQPPSQSPQPQSLSAQLQSMSFQPQSMSPQPQSQAHSMSPQPQFFSSQQQFVSSTPEASSQPQSSSSQSESSAAPPAQNYTAQIAQLSVMGFTDESACIAALERSNGDVQQALESLLG
jgi:ankyrin repeat protein